MMNKGDLKVTINYIDLAQDVENIRYAVKIMDSVKVLHYLRRLQNRLEQSVLDIEKKVLDEKVDK